MKDRAGIAQASVLSTYCLLHDLKQDIDPSDSLPCDPSNWPDESAEYVGHGRVGLRESAESDAIKNAKSVKGHTMMTVLSLFHRTGEKLKVNELKQQDFHPEIFFQAYQANSS